MLGRARGIHHVMFSLMTGAYGHALVVSESLLLVNLQLTEGALQTGTVMALKHSLFRAVTHITLLAR